MPNIKKKIKKNPSASLSTAAIEKEELNLQDLKNNPLVEGGLRGHRLI